MTIVPSAVTSLDLKTKEKNRDAFLAVYEGRSGTIDLWELRQVLEVAFFLGQKPTEEELFQNISVMYDNMSGSIGRRA